MASRLDFAAAISRAAAVFEVEDRSLLAIANATRAEIYLRLSMADEAASLGAGPVRRNPHMHS